MKSTFILIFMILIKMNSYSQNGDIRAFYEVHINNRDFSERAAVYSGKQIIHAKEDRPYYWYSSNKIMSTMGGFDGKLLNGEYVAFYLNSNLKEKGNFHKGLKNAKWFTWYPNGIIETTTNWKKGLKHGKFRHFDANGVLLSVSSYRYDQLDGEMINYEGGKEVSVKKYRRGEIVTPVTKNKKTGLFKLNKRKGSKKNNLKEPVDTLGRNATSAIEVKEVTKKSKVKNENNKKQKSGQSSAESKKIHEPSKNDKKNHLKEVSSSARKDEITFIQKVSSVFKKPVKKVENKNSKK